MVRAYKPLIYIPIIFYLRIYLFSILYIEKAPTGPDETELALISIYMYDNITKYKQNKLSPKLTNNTLDKVSTIISNLNNNNEHYTSQKILLILQIYNYTKKHLIHTLLFLKLLTKNKIQIIDLHMIEILKSCLQYKRYRIIIGLFSRLKRHYNLHTSHILGNEFIYTLLKCKQYTYINTILYKMRRYKVTSYITYNMILYKYTQYLSTSTTTKNNGLKPSININNILSILNDMIYDKIKIPYTYITQLLSYYITNKQYIQAIEFYNTYHIYTNFPKSQMPVFSVFGHLISAYLKLGHFDSAWGVFQEYNTIVYNSTNTTYISNTTTNSNSNSNSSDQSNSTATHTNNTTTPTTATTTTANTKSSSNTHIKYNKKDIYNIYINILNGCCIHNKHIEAILILSILYPQHVIIKPQSLTSTTSSGGGVVARLTLGHNILKSGGAVEVEKEVEDKVRLGQLLGVKRTLSPMVYEASLNACCNFHMWKEGLSIYDDMRRLGEA